MSADARFTRIVSLVADLTRRSEGATLGELASTHDVTEREITADIRTLTLLGENAEADWLLSLGVWQQDERVSISSAGPFRRPVQLSPEEQLAIQVALALNPDASDLARRFAALFTNRDPGKPSQPDGEVPDESLIARAVRESREIRISYTAEGERSASAWLLEPHQLVESHGRTYIVAWACDTNDWRHFRLDRVLSVSLTGRPFARRDDFKPLEGPGDVFQPGEEMDRVTVRFTSAVAPAVAERYPVHELQADGGVVVRFTASSPAWMARTVLEYGADAQVMEPELYRRAVREAVA